MFKSSFSKYLLAFVIIILISFVMLSGIITSMLRTHLSEDKEEKMRIVTTSLAEYFESKEDVNNILNIVQLGPVDALVDIITMALAADYDFNIIITDEKGQILLTTFRRNDDGSPAITHIPGDLGVIKIDDERFKRIPDSNGEEFLRYSGRVDEITNRNFFIYGKEINVSGRVKGYSFIFSDTTKEDKLIGITRNTVINSSIWVMLAAVLAAYFITERIIHPLRTMSIATKKFGKGDFSERVEVYGRDEVAELAKSFNNMAESLDNLEKMRNSFLASVSHDLRTPMTTISGFIDGIISGAIPQEQQNHYLEVIRGEIHRLSRLVSQLLDISRLESGDRKFNFTDFDVAEVTRLILISFEQKIDDKHLDVEFDAEADTMIVHADKDAIYQVIYNLCHNAIKFAKEGGKFAIKLHYDSNKKVRISVYDEGQTLTDEAAQHVFDRFYKTDTSRGLDKTGVGLGLYISKTIIDAHNEEINVVSHEEGCEFAFTLAVGNQNNRK